MYINISIIFYRFFFFAVALLKIIVQANQLKHFQYSQKKNDNEQLVKTKHGTTRDLDQLLSSHSSSRQRSSTDTRRRCLAASSSRCSSG